MGTMPRYETGVRPPEHLDPKDIQILEAELTAGLCGAEAEEVRDCFAYVRGLFGEQLRRDGVTPTWFHSYMVAYIVKKEFGISGKDYLLGGLLHDVVEDCRVSPPELEARFSRRVADLVDGVTKMKKPNGEDDDFNTRVKVLSSSYIRPDTAVIKLADRLHNMRTLEHVSKAKQLEKARETRDVYIPLAEAFGLWQVKQELEDRTARFLNPEGYNAMKMRMEADPRLEPEFVDYVRSAVAAVVGTEYDTGIETRIKGVWRSEAKSALRGLASVNDLLKIRVVVSEDQRKGLTALQVRALVVDTLQREFGEQVRYDMQDNYIYANRRPNGYEGVQLTVEFLGKLVEVSVATREEEEFNNWGVVTMMRRGETLDQRLLKPIMVEREGHSEEDQTGVRAVYVPLKATAIDVAYAANVQKAKFLSMVWVRGVGGELIACQPTEVIQGGSVLKLEYSEGVPSISEAWLKYCLPETRRLIEVQVQEIENELIIAGGRQQIEGMLRQRGLMDLEDIEPDKVKRVLEVLGDSKDMLNADLKLYGWEYVCWAVGKGLIEGKKIEQAMDEAGVTAAMMEVTTVFMKGVHDQPGILYRLLGWLNNAPGGAKNVTSTETRTDESGGYVIKLVVKGMSSGEEESLRHFLSGNGQGGFPAGFFTEWTVVGRRDGGEELSDSTMYLG